MPFPDICADMTDNLEERINHFEERTGPSTESDDLFNGHVDPGSYYTDFAGCPFCLTRKYSANRSARYSSSSLESQLCQFGQIETTVF